MSCIALADFQKLSGLSDAAIGRLASGNHLVWELGEQGELLVNLKESDVDAVVASVAQRQSRLLERKHAVLREHVSAIISEELETLWSEAVQRLGQLPENEESES